MRLGRGLFLRNADLLARYNEEFNGNLDAALRRLDRIPAALGDQLGHLLFMDALWLVRLGCAFDWLAIRATGGMQRAAVRDRADWYAARLATDAALTRFVGELNDVDLERRIEFVTEAEQASVQCSVWAGLTHLFNHQSLHRGEMLRLLATAGIAFGNSDLLPLIVDVIAVSSARRAPVAAEVRTAP